MTRDDDAKAKLDAIKADNEKRKQIEAERKKIAENQRADFDGSVDAILKPIFRAKAVALHSDSDPACLGPRAIFYRNCTLFYAPMWNQVMTQIAGKDIYQHEQEKTRGNYVHLRLTAKELHHRMMREFEKNLRSLDIRIFARSEPYWGHIVRRETVTDVRHYEGASMEERKVDFIVEPILRTTDMIVQDLVEAMVRYATV